VAAEYIWHRNPDEDPFADHLDELAKQMGLTD